MIGNTRYRYGRVVVVCVIVMGFTLDRARAQVPSNKTCFAIRGNGELMPAHWGAMAQAIEMFGVPSGVAGGSSAAISSFLLESVVLNPLVQNASDSQKALVASYLIKSFEGFTQVLASRPEWKALGQFIHTMIDGSSQPALLQRLSGLLNSPAGLAAVAVIQSAPLAQALGELQQSQVFSGPGIVRLQNTIEQSQKKSSREASVAVQYAAADVQKALEVFGKFDAKGDRALFLRNGVVNFTALGELFGKMAAFYAAKGMSSSSLQNLMSYLNRCAIGSSGKSWDTIVAKNLDCQNEFGKIVENYFAHEGTNQTRIHELVGTRFHTLVTTSVVLEKSKLHVLQQKAAYDRTHDESLGEQLGIDSDDLRFGFWGQPDDLALISKTYPTAKDHLPKAERFMDLGQTSWATVLATSPAEPGLSSVTLFQGKSGQQMMSIGGWSDLHPIPVLKAAGCERVVYLTRQGGDSLFSQGVAKRLFQLGDESVRWEDLDSNAPGAQARNDRGIVGDQTSLWSMMYNLANPKSSYAGSLAQADAVICTNWDTYSLRTDFSKMIEEAYNAPVYIPNTALASLSKSIKSPASPMIGASDRDQLDSQGSLRYAGCIPRM